jgi:hypothetical protein
MCKHIEKKEKGDLQNMIASGEVVYSKKKSQQRSRKPATIHRKSVDDVIRRSLIYLNTPWY